MLDLPTAQHDYYVDNKQAPPTPSCNRLLAGDLKMKYIFDIAVGPILLKSLSPSLYFRTILNGAC